MTRGRARAAAGAAALLLLPGCAVGTEWDALSPLAGQPAVEPTARAAAVVPAAPADAAGADSRAVNGLSLIATLRGPTAVLDAPGGTRLLVQGDRTDEGTRQRLLVLQDGGDWLRVGLPGRPNGRSGWLRAAEVDLSATDWQLRVAVGARTLTVLRSGMVFGTYPVAVGASSTPTPTGTFYVTDLLAPPDPTGPYGPFAFGLSAYSDVITSFGNGGRGQIGLHGTDEPDSVGQAVSNGCLRLDDDVVRTLAGQLPLGTPVEITA